MDVWSLLSSRLSDAFARVAENFFVGLADALVVVLFLILGWITGKLLAAALAKFLESVKLEKGLKRRGLEDALFGFTVTGILEKFVKLLSYAAFLGIAADVVNLSFLGVLVYWFVGYVPLFLQGAVIIVLALLGVDYLGNYLKASRMPFKRFLAAAAKFFVLYTAVTMALPLVLPNADVTLLYTAFTLFLGAAAVALGLGFAIAIGFGLKDTVASVARKRMDDFERIV
ncbi:MAG: hypothetical protein WC607_00195 [Candidatus Micrarchaeia archaeon]